MIKKYLTNKFAIFALAGMTLPTLSVFAQDHSDSDNDRSQTPDITTVSEAPTSDDPVNFVEFQNVFNSILYHSARAAVSNPDMGEYGIKTTQIILDSLNTKYNADLKIPESFFKFKALQDRMNKLDDKPSTDKNSHKEVMQEISSAITLFSQLPILVQSTGATEEEITELASYAVDEILKEIDPHADYFTPKEFRKFNKRMSGQLKYGGFGFEVAKDAATGYMRIRPYDDTPASKAGLQEHDLITHINGESIKGLSLQDFVKSLKDEAGKEEIFTVRRGNQEIDFTVERDHVKSQNVISRMLDDDTGYVRMSMFSKGAARDVEKAVKDLQDDMAKKGNQLGSLVLDLRNNGGGAVGEAVDLSDLFLDQGDIVSIQTSKGIEKIFEAGPGDILSDKPLVVLTNGYSASASEMVAGALRDHGRATIIGLDTFGKGTGQRVFKLNGGHGFKVTTLHYLPPEGSIQNTGIAVNIYVTAADTISFSREADYSNAYENPNGKNNVVFERQTFQSCDIKPGVDFSSLAQTFKSLNGKPDAHLLCADEFIDAKLKQELPQYTQRKYLPTKAKPAPLDMPKPDALNMKDYRPVMPAGPTI